MVWNCVVRREKGLPDNISEVVVGNIEDIDLPWRPNTFDVLILSEVLEHLGDPVAGAKAHTSAHETSRSCVCQFAKRISLSDNCHALAGSVDAFRLWSNGPYALEMVYSYVLSRDV